VFPISDVVVGGFAASRALGTSACGWGGTRVRGGDAQRPLWLLARVLIEPRDSVERDEIT